MPRPPLLSRVLIPRRTRQGRPSTAIVEVPPPVGGTPFSLVVTPTELTGLGAATVNLTAVVRDLLGAVTNQGSLVWSSIRPGAASVVSTGSRTARATFGSRRGILGLYDMTQAEMTAGTYPQFNALLRSPTPAQLLGLLAAARTAGYGVIANLAGTKSGWVDPTTGRYREDLWKAKIDLQFATNSASALQTYLDDYTLVGHLLVDAPFSPSLYGGQAITNAQVEEMARYSRTKWPNLLTYARGSSAFFKTFAWAHLQGWWSRWSGNHEASVGLSIEDYVAQELAFAKAAGRRIMFELDLLDGGGGIPGVVTGLEAGTIDDPTRWKMTAQEISYASSVLTAEEEIDGIMCLAGVSHAYPKSAPIAATLTLLKAKETSRDQETDILAKVGAIPSNPVVARLIKPDAGSIMYPNQPTGFTVIVDEPFNSPTLAGTGWTYDAKWLARTNLAVVSDPLAPNSPNNVLEFAYPAGMTDSDVAPRATRTFAPALQQMYVAFPLALPAVWTQHIGDVSTLLYIGTSLASLGLQLAIRDAGAAGAPGYLQVKLLDPTQPSGLDVIGYFPQDIAQVLLSPTEYSRGELLLIASTNGQANGTVKLWINGILVTSRTDITFNTAAGSDPTFTALTLQPTWGRSSLGAAPPSGQTKPGRETIRIDHLRIAGTVAGTVAAPGGDIDDPPRNITDQTVTAGIKTTNFDGATTQASGHRVNASGAIWRITDTDLPGHIIRRLGFGADISWKGGRVEGQAPPGTSFDDPNDEWAHHDWTAMALGRGLRFLVEGFSCTNIGDGIGLNKDSIHILDGCKGSVIRFCALHNTDDCVEDDVGDEIIIYMSALYGHSPLSTRPGTDARLSDGRLIRTVDMHSRVLQVLKSIIWLEPFIYPDKGPAPITNSFFKWNTASPDLGNRIILEDLILQWDNAATVSSRGAWGSLPFTNPVGSSAAKIVRSVRNALCMPFTPNGVFPPAWPTGNIGDFSYLWGDDARRFLNIERTKLYESPEWVAAGTAIPTVGIFPGFPTH